MPLERSRLRADGVEAIGVVVARELSRTEVNHEVLFNHTIEFAGPGGPVRFNHRDVLLRKGQQVGVRYDPVDPAQAIVSRVERAADA